MKKNGAITVNGKTYPNVYSECGKTAVVNADYEFYLVEGFRFARKTGSFTVIFCEGRKKKRKTYGSFQNAERAMCAFVSPAEKTVKTACRTPAPDEGYER